MNGVAREYWREVFSLEPPADDANRRSRPRPKGVKLRGRQKVAEDHRLGSR
jgi:hypothetical protein